MICSQCLATVFRMYNLMKRDICAIVNLTESFTSKVLVKVQFEMSLAPDPPF